MWPGIFGLGGDDYFLAFSIEAGNTFTKQEDSKEQEESKM